jgi:hypothetical protein
MAAPWWKRLRAKGYALVEFKPGTAPPAGSPEAAAATAPGLSLHYVLDAAASPNLYRDHRDGGAEIAQPRLPGAEQPRGAGWCLGSQGVIGDG